MHASILQSSTLQCNGINTVKSAELKKKKKNTSKEIHKYLHNHTGGRTKSGSLERLHETSFKVLVWVFHASSVLWIKTSCCPLSKGNQFKPCFYVIEDYQTNMKEIQVHTLMFIHVTLENLCNRSRIPNHLPTAERK